MKEVLQAWWRQLAQRERLLIGWGGTGLLLALAYAYVWLPLDVERHKLRAALPTLRSAASQMRAQADEAARLRGATVAAPSGAALRGAVQAAVGDAGKGKNSQLESLDENHVAVSWPSISFDAWAALVSQLQTDARVRLESVAVDTLPEPGMVRVQAVFASGG